MKKRKRLEKVEIDDFDRRREPFQIKNISGRHFF